MFVDQQIIATHLLDGSQAVQKPFFGWKKVAVEQAVVVHARGRERISDKEDGLAVVVFRHKAAVIDGLAGKVRVSEFEFVPALACAVVHCLDAMNRVGRQTRHAIGLGMFQNVPHFLAEGDGAMKFVRRRLRYVAMVVVIVRDIDAVKLLDDTLLS